MTCQRKPICGIYNLHKRQEQFSGFQSLIIDLKMLIFPEPFIFCRTISHILGPKYELTSDP